MPGSFVLLRYRNIVGMLHILFSLTMMGNSRTPEDTETFLKITTNFKEKYTQKEKMKKLAQLISGRGYQLAFVLEKINSPVTDQRRQFATMLLKKHSC